MDDKLTRKSQEALSAAIRQAASDGNPQVEPVHLLLALLKQADGTAQPLLEAAGADMDRVLHGGDGAAAEAPADARCHRQRPGDLPPAAVGDQHRGEPGQGDGR